MNRYAVASFALSPAKPAVSDFVFRSVRDA